MPEKVPRRQKLDALTLVAAGHTRSQAASLMHISKSTIARAKRKQRLHGDIEGGTKKRGRRAKFTPEILNVIPHFFINAR
jgi:transposase